ncbi:MAG: IS3 family transposase [Methylobacter sp.]
MTRRLQEEGKSASRHRVARLMKDNGLRAKAAKRYKATTNSNHSLPVAPNLFEQDFTADVPDQKWMSDITYIWTEEG